MQSRLSDSHSLTGGKRAVDSTRNDHNQVTGREILRALGLGAGLGITLGLITGFGLRPVLPFLQDVNWLATIIATEVYLSLVLGHVLVFGGFRALCRRLHIDRLTWPQLRLALAVWLLWWAVLFVGYAILHPILDAVGQMGDAILKIGSLYGRLDGASPALFAAALIQPVLLAPFFEEVLFRGSLWSWLRSKRGAIATTIITAAIFALLHPLVWLWPAAFLFGLAAGWVRERTGSVTPMLVAHMLNTLAMVALAYFVTGWHVR